MFPWLRSQYWSPYLAGAIIGLTQIPAYFMIKTSLGTSGSFGTISCLLQNAAEYTACFPKPKTTWQLGFVIGIVIGAWLSKTLSGNKRAAISSYWRTAFPNNTWLWRSFTAFVGGVLFMWGALLATGCTSGNGVSGVSLLYPGSLAAIAAMFGSGIVVSRFFAKVPHAQS